LFSPASWGDTPAGPFRNLELIEKIQQDRYCRGAADYGSKTMAAVCAFATIPLNEEQFP
jgi:hypothetical protein